MNEFDQFAKKKADESEFLSLKSGETATIASLREIKIVTKAGFGGEEKEVMRLTVDVKCDDGKLRIKKFDNGTARFATELSEKGVKLGSSFKLHREGEQTKTRYTVTEVANAGTATPAAPAEAKAVADFE